MTHEPFPFLAGKLVEELRFGQGEVRLTFELSNDPEPAAYADVQYVAFGIEGGEGSRLDLENDPASAGVLLRLLGQRVANAWADRGILTIVFENGDELRAYPESDYETWALRGGGSVYQCLPGGDIASW